MMNGNFGTELGMPQSDLILNGESNTKRDRPRHTNESGGSSGLEFPNGAILEMESSYFS